jgi:hypothetical protein
MKKLKAKEPDRDDFIKKMRAMPAKGPKGPMKSGNMMAGGGKKK